MFWVVLYVLIAIAGLKRLRDANDDGPGKLNLVDITLAVIVGFVIVVPIGIVALAAGMIFSPFAAIVCALLAVRLASISLQIISRILSILFECVVISLAVILAIVLLLAGLSLVV